MPTLTANIQSHGPIIQVAVLVSIPRSTALKAAGLTPPSPVIINGLIDTGASCTCIDPAVFHQLGIQPTGFTQIVTPSTGKVPHQCKQFDVAIGIFLRAGDIHIIETLPVVEASLGHQGHQALIGRDILSQGILIYNGNSNSLTIAF